MKNLLQYFMLISLLSTPTYSQPMGDISESDLEEIESLKSEANIRRRDLDTGIEMSDYNTSSDQNRASLLYHINHDASSITGVTTFEFNYAHRFEEYWLELTAAKTTAKFNEITKRNTEYSIYGDELSEQSEDLTTIGAGFGLRNNWIQNLIPSPKIFSTTTAFLTYNQFKENFLSQSFSGPGLKADFGIHRRSSDSMHYGGKMSYNLAQVKRKASFDGETSSSRSLLLSWLSFAFDISFYF
ncbi:hypothetical protein OAT67_04050 [Bacteriovoracaceae bacterium]|nr:hypothetical protein [Bacteriovoracaceae bacterium]|tara:strand:- start:63650 stop:64375 length:726 start_codon:yes stop_codon:yes gene_type:complete